MYSRLGKALLFIALLFIASIGILFNSVIVRSWNLFLYSLDGQNKSLCACPECFTADDPWFRDLIKESPPVFLSKNYSISLSDFNWWKRIQFQRYSFAVYNQTVKDIFEVFPPVPDVEERNPDNCRTCAVVGNSGNLNGSRFGPLIDFHDIVIRINRSPTKGYEADVGTKTTHHVMYPVSASTVDNSTHLVFFPFKIKDFQWLLKQFEPKNVTSQRIANKDLVMILNPAYMKYIHQKWLQRKGRYPSTGFLTVALSLNICDQVSVFGFGADRHGNWNHYFEILKNPKLKTGQHPGSHEYQFIQKLYQKEILGFYKW